MKIKKKELRALLLEIIGPDELLELEITVHRIPPGVREFHLPVLRGIGRNNLRHDQRWRVKEILERLDS